MMISDKLSLVYHDALPLLFLDIIDQGAIKSRQRITCSSSINGNN